MNASTNLFITTLSILLLSNIGLYFIYPTNANLLSLTGIASTAFILIMMIALIVISFQILGSGLSDAKPIIAFIILIEIGRAHV